MARFPTARRQVASAGSSSPIAGSAGASATAAVPVTCIHSSGQPRSKGRVAGGDPTRARVTYDVMRNAVRFVVPVRPEALGVATSR